MDAVFNQQSPNPVPTSSSQPPESSPLIPKKIIITVLAIVVLTVAVIGAGVGVSRYERNLKNKAAKSPAPVIRQNQEASLSAITLPVTLDNPNLDSFVLVYNFRGNIIEIKDNPERLELVTDVKGAGVPKFIVTENTQVFFLTPDKSVSASSADLRLNQKIRILAVYNVKNKSWTTNRVSILVESIPSSTSSATIKQ